MSKEAERAAELITGNPIGCSRLTATAYGKKTSKGIADLIDRMFDGRQVRCHSEHVTTHALWDCPVCVVEKERQLHKEIEGLTLQMATQKGIIETLVNNDQFMPAARELLRVATKWFVWWITPDGPTGEEPPPLAELEAAMRGAKDVGI